MLLYILFSGRGVADSGRLVICLFAQSGHGRTASH